MTVGIYSPLKLENPENIFFKTGYKNIITNNYTAGQDSLVEHIFTIVLHQIATFFFFIEIRDFSSVNACVQIVLQ